MQELFYESFMSFSSPFPFLPDRPLYFFYFILHFMNAFFSFIAFADFPTSSTSLKKAKWHPAHNFNAPNAICS